MSKREPILNAPRVVVWLLAAFFVVHLVRYFLPDDTNLWVTTVLAFIPARLSGLSGELPGGQVAIVTQFATHLFVHGDVMHLLINSAWLLAFGSAVARRTDTVNFLAFFLLCGAAGALAYAAVNRGALSLVVGASGAISGLMGAAFRYLFQALEDGDTEGLAGETRRPPLLSVADTLRNRRIMLAVVGWIILNIVLAFAAANLAEAGGIAWEAHIGGFYMGLLTYGFFDSPPPIQQHVGEKE